MPDPANQIQNHRQHNAQQDRSRQREIERCVLASVKNVAGEAPNRKIRSAEKKQEQSNGDEHNAKKHQHLAYVSHYSIVKAKGPRPGRRP